jgi:hypothetical protein
MGSKKRRERRIATIASLHAEAQSPTNELTLVGSGPIELLHAAEGATEATRFLNQVVYTGGVMFPQLNMANGYQGAAVVSCDGVEIDSDTPLNRDHDPARPVGHCPDVHSDGKQLLASGEFSVQSDETREITSSKRFPWKTSIGLILLEWEIVREGQTLQANGRTFEGPVLFVSRSKLKHIAILSEPGDMNVPRLMLAQLTQGNAAMGFEAWVASLGLDVATLTPEAMEALQNQYNAQSGASSEGGDSAAASASSDGAPSDDQPPPTATASNGAGNTLLAGGNGARSNQTNDLAAQYRETLAAEHARATELRTLCARFNDPTVSINGTAVNLAAHAIRAGWTAERTELEARRHQELEAMRNSRSAGPGIHSTSRSQRGSLHTLQAALLLRANIALDCAQFQSSEIRDRLPEWLRAGVNDSNRQRIMDQAHEFRSISMLEAAGMALNAIGQDVPRNRVDMLQAAFSSGAVTQLFGATLGAQVLASYAEIEDFSRGWTQDRENPDMEFHSRIRMEAAGDLSLHPAGGEADHATRAARSEQSKVDRFSRQMNIDEADFMSDNFGKLADTPRDFGLAAGRVRPSLVAAILLANPSLLVTGRQLFNATDVSDIGTGQALDRAPLSLAIAKLGLRRDGDASLNLRATHLLVPPSLRDTAVQLTKSDIVMVDGGKGSKNVLKDYNITPVSEARLENGMIDPVTKAALSGSSTNWILVSSEAHTIEVTYLEGAGRVPIVTTNPLMNGAFGLNISVRHYVGSRAQDFKGFVRGRA